MANSVDIIIKAVDKASGEINKVTGAGNKLATGFKSLTGITLGAGAALAGIGAAAKFIGDAVNETVEYATEIDNTARLLGLTTEETSRLVQASDDLFISQEKLSSGLQAATRQGIDVSIEGLKKLSAQYLAMPEGVGRSEFVLKTFGRSGAEMGKLMEIGADGIDAATAAIADNMIITQKSMGDIMNYKRSIDNMNDSWQGVKYTIGQAVIPTLDLLFRALTQGKDDVELHQQAVNRLEREIESWSALVAFGDQSAVEATAALQAELDALRDGFYGVEKSATDVGESIYGLSDIITPVTVYFSDLTTEMLFNQAAAGLDAEASMALAESMGLIDGETKIVLDALGRLRSDLDTGKISLEEYNAQVATLNERMALIQSKTVTITVRTNYEDQSGLWGQGRNAYIGLSSNNQATGGIGGGWTKVGERGEEIVNLPAGSRVYSNTQTNQLTGGAVEVDYDKLGRVVGKYVGYTLAQMGLL